MSHEEPSLEGPWEEIPDGNYEINHHGMVRRKKSANARHPGKIIMLPFALLSGRCCYALTLNRVKRNYGLQDIMQKYLNMEISYDGTWVEKARELADKENRRIRVEIGKTEERERKKTGRPRCSHDEPIQNPNRKKPRYCRFCGRKLPQNRWQRCGSCDALMQLNNHSHCPALDFAGQYNNPAVKTSTF